MASDFSFDVVSEIDLNLVKESIQVAMKEIVNRYDFKGADASIELDEKRKVLVVRASDEARIEAALDVLYQRMAKRGLPLSNLHKGKLEQALGQTARMEVSVESGIASEKAKEMVAAIKQAKLKVNASIQGEQLRVAGKSKDELQRAMALLRGGSFGVELQFKNFR
ncbi:MAG: YajQ family cyclic di-GMP-binding protein [Elusimicrobia bacterium]|nr:YajQ family cyclic di-GMP-binding protein [Elusimicrobiota bacterium]MDE2237315.1 YajQ family cyclic di-GMP-binding protein [Elusimicrobiota bacterium]MDE2426510.1 YajQ family cyclic di-GMP-binding protein [Elusimicrobiota bacterium]